MRHQASQFKCLRRAPITSCLQCAALYPIKTPAIQRPVPTKKHNPCVPLHTEQNILEYPLNWSNVYLSDGCDSLSSIGWRGHVMFTLDSGSMFWDRQGVWGAGVRGGGS